MTSASGSRSIVTAQATSPRVGSRPSEVPAAYVAHCSSTVLPRSAAARSTRACRRGVSVGPGLSVWVVMPAWSVDVAELAHQVEDAGVDRAGAGARRLGLEAERAREHHDPRPRHQARVDRPDQPEQAAELDVGAAGEVRRRDRLDRAGDRQSGGEDRHPHRTVEGGADGRHGAVVGDVGHAGRHAGHLGGQGGQVGLVSTDAEHTLAALDQPLGHGPAEGAGRAHDDAEVGSGFRHRAGRRARPALRRAPRPRRAGPRWRARRRCPRPRAGTA